MNCRDDCKFWSDKIAKGNADNSDVEALCLNAKSPNYHRYMPGKRGKCDFGEPGEPIDLRA